MDPKPVSKMLLAELIAETSDPSLSMASGGETTVRRTLEVMALPHGGRYLEVGCAAGWQAVRVAHARPDVSVVGTDPQEAAIESARGTTRRLCLRNAVFMVGDARQLVFADGTFHGTFAGNIPTFVPAADRAGLIQECARVTAPSGVVVAAPMFYPDGLPDARILDAVEALIGTPIHRGREQEWIELYERQGLTLTKRWTTEFREPTDAAIEAYVDRVMDDDKLNGHHPAPRRRELRDALLHSHLLFRENNRFLGFSVLGFQHSELAGDSAGPLAPVDGAGPPWIV